MTTQHTPGPWIIDPNHDLPLAIIEDTEDGQGVCEIQDAGQKASEATPEQWERARLIAAAPDLLEALNDALALMVNGPSGCDDDPARIISAARAAIAKAKGE